MSIIENCVENFNFERKRKTAFEMSFRELFKLDKT